MPIVRGTKQNQFTQSHANSIKFLIKFDTTNKSQWSGDFDTRQSKNQIFQSYCDKIRGNKIITHLDGDGERPAPNANVVAPIVRPFPLNANVDHVHIATFSTICDPVFGL
jgi:hypothetical protein